jgi:hypothetical protein
MTMDNTNDAGAAPVETTDIVSAPETEAPSAPPPDGLPEGFEWVTVKADSFNKTKKLHVNGVEFEVEYGSRQMMPAILAEAVRNANLAA